MHLFLLSDVWLLHVDVLFCKCRHQSTVMRLFYSYFLFGVYHDILFSYLLKTGSIFAMIQVAVLLRGVSHLRSTVEKIVKTFRISLTYRLAIHPVILSNLRSTVKKILKF